MAEFNDPFASAPADEAQTETTPEPPQETVFDQPPAEAPEAPAPKKAPAKKAAISVDVKPNLLPLDEGKVVLTFKGGTGFDAPWIVIHATSMEDAHEQVSGEGATLLAATMERVQAAGKHFACMGGGSKSGGGAPQRAAAPAAAQQPPAGSPACPGEGWVYKSGVSKSGPKAGQTWQAWMPPQHLKDAGTKPVWF